MTRLKRYSKASLVILVTMFLGLNAVALLHARAMTHFVPNGIRTAFPEQLSLWDKVVVLLTGVTVPRPRNGQLPTDFNLASEDCTFTTSDGIRLAAWLIPTKDSQITFAMFHGYAGSRAFLLEEAVLLHDMGYTLLLVDFRGSGDSQGDTTTIGVDEARDVEATLAEARKRCPGQRIIALGQSMGAAAILRAVHTGLVSPDGMVLEAPFDRMLSTVENRFTAMRVPSWPFANLLVYWGGWSIGIDAFTHNPVDYARSVKCPTLVFNGDQDRRVHPVEAIAVHDALQGWKRVKIFNGVGHLMYARKHPREWKALVAELASNCHRTASLGGN